MGFNKTDELEKLQAAAVGEHRWLTHAQNLQDNAALDFQEIVQHLANPFIARLAPRQRLDAWRLLTQHVPERQDERKQFIEDLLGGMEVNSKTQKSVYAETLMRTEISYYLINKIPTEGTLDCLKNIILFNGNTGLLKTWMDMCIENSTDDKEKSRECLRLILEHFVDINDDIFAHDQRTPLEFLIGRNVEGPNERRTKLMLIDVLLDEGATWKHLEENSSHYPTAWKQICEHPRVIRDQLEDVIVKHVGGKIIPKM